MKEKIKNIWKTHKTEILIGGGILVGGAVIFILTRKITDKRLPKLPIGDAVGPKEDFWWNFENLDDAMIKFKEIEEICINLGKSEVALFGGGGPNAGKYTVMHL